MAAHKIEVRPAGFEPNLNGREAAGHLRTTASRHHAEQRSAMALVRPHKGRRSFIRTAYSGSLSHMPTGRFDMRLVIIGLWLLQVALPVRVWKTCWWWGGAARRLLLSR